MAISHVTIQFLEEYPDLTDPHSCSSPPVLKESNSVAVTAHLLTQKWMLHIIHASSESEEWMQFDPVISPITACVLTW